jgi:hypothetical protein
MRFHQVGEVILQIVRCRVVWPAVEIRRHPSNGTRICLNGFWSQTLENEVLPHLFE